MHGAGFVYLLWGQWLNYRGSGVEIKVQDRQCGKCNVAGNDNDFQVFTVVHLTELVVENQMDRSIIMGKTLQASYGKTDISLSFQCLTHCCCHFDVCWIFMELILLHCLLHFCYFQFKLCLSIVSHGWLSKHKPATPAGVNLGTSPGLKLDVNQKSLSAVIDCWCRLRGGKDSGGKYPFKEISADV